MRSVPVPLAGQLLQEAFPDHLILQFCPSQCLLCWLIRPQNFPAAGPHPSRGHWREGFITRGAARGWKVLPRSSEHPVTGGVQAGDQMA